MCDTGNLRNMSELHKNNDVWLNGHDMEANGYDAQIDW